jgi:hypothetical protein
MHINKKLIALPLLIAIALSIAGYAYAHWSDAIRINGRVHMASCTLAFMELEPPVEYYWKDGVRYLGEPRGKDVANTTSWLSEIVYDPHSNKTGYEKMHILVVNAYPEYEVHCTFVVRNIGTMPLDIIGMTITDLTGYLTFAGNGTVPNPWRGFVDKDQDGVQDPDEPTVINIWSIDLVGEQLEPCVPEKAELDMHIKEEAEECHTYHFEVTISYEQYDP